MTTSNTPEFKTDQRIVIAPVDVRERRSSILKTLPEALELYSLADVFIVEQIAESDDAGRRLLRIRDEAGRILEGLNQNWFQAA
jgi:hypothetical protein